MSAQAGTVRVLLFAVAAERAGARSLDLEVSAATAGAVRRALAEKVPALASLLPLCALAVDGEYAEDGTEVLPGAEVAVIPPVSGGGEDGLPYGAISDRSIDDAALVRKVEDPSAGGIVVFYGTVRGTTGAQVTDRLEYDSYAELAEREMHRILGEVMAQVPESRIAAVHRTGALEVGEVAVVVAASAPHRDGAFLAARTAIDRIKAEVPIWKREIGPDGKEWVDGTPVAGAPKARAQGEKDGSGNAL